jgi:glutathione S-transferase
VEEEGRPTLFESGAIILDVATRAGKLIPDRAEDRALVTSWSIAALNSIEPFLMNLAEVDFFMEDEEEKAKRRPGVLAMAEQRLGELQAALGDRKWLVGREFTVADLLVSSVLKIARSLDILGKFPKLVAYQDRCLDRPAYRKAVEDQKRTIDDHTMADMRFEACARS